MKKFNEFNKLNENDDQDWKNVHNDMFGTSNNQKENIKENNGNGISQSKMKEFYDKVYHIVDFEEEDEITLGLSNSDILSEVGDLMDQMNLTTQDLRDIVDAYPNDIYIEQYVKVQLEYEDEEKEKRIKSFKQKSDIITKVLLDHVFDVESVDDLGKLMEYEEVVLQIIKAFEKLKKD